MNIAVIPARGGSKRIPGKNLREFAGRPVLQYSISAAIDSQLFQRVIVSTDCEQIANLAVESGAEVPFRRPVELADDFTPTVPVVRHAISAVPYSRQITNVCCIYATAPFLWISDLQESLRSLEASSELEFVFPVTTFSFPIFRSLRRVQSSQPTADNHADNHADSHAANQDNGRVAMIWPEHELTRSQDLPEAFHDAGQFYWGTAQAWRKRDRIYSSNSAGYLIPRYRVQDLDTPEDWLRAEAMYEVLQRTEK